MSSLTPLQAFTAIGTIADDAVYQHKMANDFVPFRRNVAYKPALKPLPIKPLIEELDFIENKKSWGYKFRFGFFEVSKKDYQLIEHKMMDQNSFL